MPVITIHGKEASGVLEIGMMVAKELHIDYVDNRVIADVAERLHRHELDVAKKEVPNKSVLERIAVALSMSGGSLSQDYNSDNGEMFYMPMEMYPWEVPLDDKVYLQTLKLVIVELAKSGMIVIRGRGSQFILKDFPGVFHVLIVAPIGLRVQRAMDSFHLDEESAKRQIKRSDDNHREFNKRYFHAENENPLDYDLVLNTKRITFEDATRIITRSISPEKETKHLFSASIN